jgi:ABC-type histidine transport system ATPase subunit
MATVLHVEGLKKSYGAFEALKGVSFEVKEGEVFALIGPNCAGKTTTFWCGPSLFHILSWPHRTSCWGDKMRFYMGLFISPSFSSSWLRS